MTQLTSGGAVTANSNCCANCVEPPRPQHWGPDLPFFGVTLINPINKSFQFVKFSDGICNIHIQDA